MAINWTAIEADVNARLSTRQTEIREAAAEALATAIAAFAAAFTDDADTNYAWFAEFFGDVSTEITSQARMLTGEELSDLMTSDMTNAISTALASLVDAALPGSGGDVLAEDYTPYLA